MWNKYIWCHNTYFCFFSINTKNFKILPPSNGRGESYLPVLGARNVTFWGVRSEKQECQTGRISLHKPCWFLMASALQLDTLIVFSCRANQVLWQLKTLCLDWIRSTWTNMSIMSSCSGYSSTQAVFLRFDDGSRHCAVCGLGSPSFALRGDYRATWLLSGLYRHADASSS